MYLAEQVSQPDALQHKIWLLSAANFCGLLFLYIRNKEHGASVQLIQNDSTKTGHLIQPEIINVSLNKKGRLVGLEPTTSCSTDKRSAIELQPPYYG